MRPAVRGFAQEYGDRIEFQEHNIASEEGSAWAEAYALFGHPAFLLLDSQGVERWRAIGVIPSDQLEAELIAVLP